MIAFPSVSASAYETAFVLVNYFAFVSGLACYKRTGFAFGFDSTSAFESASEMWLQYYFQSDSGSETKSQSLSGS